MKKLLLTVVGALSFGAAHSQEISTFDALRYAQDNFNGTARFRAMGGAFGALGGDLSSINVNPAGSAVFVNNQFGATLANFSTNTDSNYFGTSTSENNNSFDLNQAGAVFVFDNDDENSGWRKLTLAINYENQLLDNRLFAAGTNPTNSISGYFLNFANMDGGIPLSTITNNPYENLFFEEQQAFLGYEAYIINPSDTGNGTPYTSNIPGGGNYYQENSMEAVGYNGKVTFNAATQYKDKWYFGLNLNSHFTDYRQVNSIYESNSNDPATGAQRTRFTNELYTYGTGFSFGLGTIAKVTNEIRLGLAYESPTWFTLYDELQQSIGTAFIGEGGDLEEVIVDPGIINVYEGYRLQTPGKWTGSFAYVFGKSGLISVDYTLKDYSNTKFGPTSDYHDLNTEMANTLDTTNEIRVGAEYRVKDFSFRGGFRNEQSPFKNTEIMGDLTGYSAGIGYNFGDTKLDIAYSYSQRDYQQSFLTSGLTDPADYKAVNNNVSLTLLFEL
ncbi:MAG TPA: outer membrane protein transport protein [Flavobacterium sp.]|jgi:hypothetical protein